MHQDPFIHRHKLQLTAKELSTPFVAFYDLQGGTKEVFYLCFPEGGNDKIASSWQMAYFDEVWSESIQYNFSKQAKTPTMATKFWHSFLSRHDHMVY